MPLLLCNDALIFLAKTTNANCPSQKSTKKESPIGLSFFLYLMFYNLDCVLVGALILSVVVNNFRLVQNWFLVSVDCDLLPLTFRSGKIDASKFWAICKHVLVDGGQTCRKGYRVKSFAIVEGAVLEGCYLAKDDYFFQLLATVKCVGVDVCYTAWNCYGCKSGEPKCVCINFCNAGWDVDSLQTCAVFKQTAGNLCKLATGSKLYLAKTCTTGKCIRSDGGYTAWNGYFLQRYAMFECACANCCDTFVKVDALQLFAIGKY